MKQVVDHLNIASLSALLCPPPPLLPLTSYGIRRLFGQTPNPRPLPVQAVPLPNRHILIPVILSIGRGSASGYSKTPPTT
eukprot:754421-Hanusia_phi.AAC.4